MADEYDDINPVPGLKTDMELLLSHFANSTSVRYSEFAKIWRQMGFPTIFCGWGKEEALREMIEIAFKMSVGFWSDVYTFQVRMGGLYLMYSFYFSQPLEPPQKVRLTQSQWAGGRKLLELVRDQKHLDAEYIYHKLHYYRAIYYVMAPLPYQIAQTRRSNRDDNWSKKEIPTGRPEPRATSVPNVFPPSLISNMESLHKQYREMKSQFISAENIQEAEGLHTLKDDFCDVLKNGLKHMESWRPGSSSFDPDSVKKITAALVPTSPGQQGENRRRLKEHAFERSGIMGRHQRHLVLDSSQSSDSEKTFATPKRRPKKKRVSEDTGSVSQDEVAKASMPLIFADDYDDDVNDEGGQTKKSSEDGGDDMLLKAFNDRSRASTSMKYDSDEKIAPTMEGADVFANVKTDSKKGGKGKKTKQKSS